MHRYVSLFFAALLSSCFASKGYAAQAALFVPPPRTIADITTILDQERPDEAAIAKNKALANTEPPRGANGAELAEFYYVRGYARMALGRVPESIEDANKAIEIGKNSLSEHRWYRISDLQFLVYQYAGDYKKSLQVCLSLLRAVNHPGSKGMQFHLARHAVQLLLSLGDADQAETYVHRIDVMLAESPGWTLGLPYRHSWYTDANLAKAELAEAKGRYREAEELYKRSESFGEIAEKDSLHWEGDYRVPIRQLQAKTNVIIRFQASNIAKQGRLAEAEFEARRALLRHLKTHGKYDALTPGFLSTLAGVLVRQGRFGEAEHLYRIAVDIHKTFGINPESHKAAETLGQLAAVLNMQHRFNEAGEVYAKLDKTIEHWSATEKQTVELNADRIYLLFLTNQLERGLAAAQALVARETARLGEKSFEAAVARGIHAIGLARAGRDAEALAEFRFAMPLLIAAPEERDYDDTAWVSARTDQTRAIAEAYVPLAARSTDPVNAGEETFPLSDAVRSQAVHRSITAASARTIIKDAGLAELARREQDEARQVTASLALLDNAITLPPEQRDEKAIARLRTAVDSAKAAHLKTRVELDNRFKGYSQLLLPKPPAVAEVQASLKDGEALLAFYFGQQQSFVWAVPKQGKIAFAAIPITAIELEDKVKALRMPLTAPLGYLNDIPPFDTQLAYTLYRALLQPVESVWKTATTLFIVTNGALGYLPLALLPAEPPRQTEGGILFANYRAVKWLVRTHATVSLPSAASLRTLRALPAGPANRLPFIGFGNPYFSEAQAAQADRAESAPAGGRGLRAFRRAAPELRGVDSADLASLPPLPDTADELRAIAAALKADPATSLKLGREANEKTVMSAGLARYRVVAFSTHGLVGGELNGLTQPALALSAPKVAGIEGDGLLTMDKILSLKLDADWTVLSACNTGTGIGAEAEAASGLGRAFFYAGSRALLVTNWPVETVSAKEIVSDLFRRQTEGPAISRAVALQQTILSMIDNSGVMADGNMIASYAHPVFWAPYTILGDGGF